MVKTSALGSGQARPNERSSPSIIAEDIRSSGYAILLHDQSVSSVVSYATEAIRYATRQVDHLIENSPGATDIECRVGCSYCCHMRTLTTPPEVLLLATFLRETRSPDQIAVLIKLLGQTSSLTRGLSDEEHGRAQIPCSLLVENECSAYQARPLECRGYSSFDADACNKAYDDYSKWEVPLHLARFSIFKNVQAGLLMALVGLGLDHEILELNAALYIALNEAGAGERWLGGEDMFGAAAIPSDDPARLALQPWSPDLWGDGAPPPV